MRTWSERKRYERDDIVVYDGYVWKALCPAFEGEEPGVTPTWRIVRVPDALTSARAYDPRIGERA